VNESIERYESSSADILGSDGVFAWCSYRQDENLILAYGENGSVEPFPRSSKQEMPELITKEMVFVGESA